MSHRRAIWPKRPHDDVFGLTLLRQRCAGAKAMHCVIDAVRSRRLRDPAHLAIAATVAIFGGLDQYVSFVFGSALFLCFGPGAQHAVWKGSVTNFVSMDYLDQQSRQHDQARSSHVLSSFPVRPLTQGHATRNANWRANIEWVKSVTPPVGDV